jgi:hypothetical protein
MTKYSGKFCDFKKHMVVIKQQKAVEFLNHGIQQPEKERYSMTW